MTMDMSVIEIGEMHETRNVTVLNNKTMIKYQANSGWAREQAKKELHVYRSNGVKIIDAYQVAAGELEWK